MGQDFLNIKYEQILAGNFLKISQSQMSGLCTCSHFMYIYKHGNEYANFKVKRQRRTGESRAE